jgi:hypothetical protein
MEPERWRFGGGATETVLHPLVLLAMLLAAIAMLCLPRRFRIATFLFATILIPSGQQILVAGVHVFIYRLIVLTGCIGIIIAKKRPASVLAGGWNSIDKAFLLYVFCHVAAFCLLYSDAAAVINQIGYIWDYVGGYIVLRYLIRNEGDATTAIKCFAYLAVILAVCMVREQVTGQNAFGLLGGVRLVSQVRDGRIRSEGVFQHAILAGTFGATLMPLLLWLWKAGKAKGLSFCGVVASAVMVLTTACSTPLMAYGAGILGICFWPFRRRMRIVRWGLVIVLVALSLAMKAPVWALIERIDLVPGSSSYHRYQLVDQFIRHFGDWWLLGTKFNAAWGNEMIDTSNAYVEEGTGGGIFALICFLAMITCCFYRLGTARKAARGFDPSRDWLFWLLGASLFAHIIAFFGIFYFDQTRVAWFALLAMVSAATSMPFARPMNTVSSRLSRDSSALHPLTLDPQAKVGQGILSAADQNG